MRSLLFASVLAIATLPAAVAHADDEVVIVVGKSQTLTVPFALGEGTNSNPKVVRAVVDPKTRRITFFGIATGPATYTVIDANARYHMITYEIRVVGEDLAREQKCLQEQIFDIDGDNVPHEIPGPCDQEPAGPSLCDADADATTEARDSCNRLADQLRNVEGIQIRASGNDVVLDGEVATPEDMDRVNAAIATERARSL